MQQICIRSIGFGMSRLENIRKCRLNRLAIRNERSAWKYDASRGGCVFLYMCRLIDSKYEIFYNDSMLEERVCIKR